MIDTITFKALIGEWNYGNDPNQHLPGYEKAEQAKQDVCCQFNEWKKKFEPIILDIKWGRQYSHGGYGAPVYDFWKIEILYEKEKE